MATEFHRSIVIFGCVLSVKSTQDSGLKPDVCDGQFPAGRGSPSGTAALDFQPFHAEQHVAIICGRNLPVSHDRVPAAAVRVRAAAYGEAYRVL
jgi:hypothetical protein